MKHIAYLPVVVMLACSAAHAQMDPLQKQLEQLKQQYAQTTSLMEQRIAALEKQIAEQKQVAARPKEGTVSAAELAMQGTEKAVVGESDQVGEKFQGMLPQDPRYDFLREADQKIDKLQQELNAFEFHGYFRS